MPTMPTEQVYVLEALVSKIQLQPGVRVEDINGLSFNFKFAQLINFDIDTAHFSSPEFQGGSDGRTITMNFGKTFLFISRPSILRQLLQTDPYQITLYDGNKTLGSTTVPWKKEFGEMVKFFESLGIVKSTTVEEVYELQNDSGTLSAKVDVFLRMSCFGPNVQTMFQIKKEGNKQEYLFRQRNASKTFKVEKHLDERCQPLVAPLYSGMTGAKSGQNSQVNFKENVSLTQLFERDNMNHKDSNYQKADTPKEEGIFLDFQQDDVDKVSICFRPSENKFFDLLNLISADVKTTNKHTEITFQKKKQRRPESFLKSVGGDLKSSPNVIIEDEDDILEMTGDKIAKRLCGNKDCPAVQKFKEYGIGPLATGKGLGTVYGDVEPPVTYGISHTYGTIREYGPYGVFARPKQDDLPFVPRTEDAEPIPVKPCKIRREEPTCCKKSKKKKEKAPKWHSPGCPLCSDRLRGGADDERMFEQEQNADEDGTVMPKSPMVECKSVMDQFDSILAEYKKAIGPCGHATCPYAQTLAEDSCKRMCENPLPPVKESSSMSCNDTPCDVEGCPYAQEPKKKRYPAGCGNPKCAYTKYKLGLLDDDAELELQFLPPALADNCGDPHCKYPLAPPLPPIHWDCPDPLPKGPCRNLNCPFQPAPLKKFKTKKQLKTGPCGSPMCPYALPQPCGVPTCPFVMVACPMTQEQSQKKKKCPPSSEENLCENPDCPFAEKNADKELIDEEDDPKFKGEFQDCVNPCCPYKKKEKKKKSKKKPKESPCGNPTCPSIKPDKKDKKKKKEKNSSEESVCSNPECPDRAKKNNSSKNRCQKGTSSESVSICSDPECPYAGLKKQKQKQKNGNGGGDTSGVASCNIGDDDSVCSNPDCPERKARNGANPDICSVPGCPYSQKPPRPTPCTDPKCPYLQPLPSCGVPNCPYEPVPLRYSCKNPKCPSKAVNFSKTFKSKPGLGNQDKPEQGNKNPENMALVLKTTTVCEDTIICDPPENCENPDCDMNEDETGTKTGSKLPSKGKTSRNKPTTVSQHKNKGKRKKKGKFVYSIGDTYPGTKLGHKECVTPVFNVPRHMGWLWNIFTPILRLKPRRGWRPGALTKTIAARIRAHRQAKGLGYLRVPTFRKDGTLCDEEYRKVVPKPTLQIQKKEGAYWITMNPLKDPYSLVENEDPYMECTPMTFKITKNKKPQEDFCYCDGDEPPEDIQSSTSSDSELDIEFTPPAGIIHPERFKKRPNVACCEAQYDPKDFEVQKKKDGKKGKGKGKDKKGKGGKGGKKGKKK